MAVMKCLSFSEYKKHTNDKGHDLALVEYELLHCLPKSRKMTITEGIEIKMNSQENLEDQLIYALPSHGSELI